MPYNGSGTFTFSGASTSFTAPTTGTTISTTASAAAFSDIATGLSTALTKDGQTTPTANIPMGSFRITNLGAATARTDAIRVSQVQDSTTLFLQGTAGTDTVTASATPAITAYVTGQKFHLFPANNNTGATTLNVNSVGAGAVQWNGAALGAGALKQNVPAIVAVVTTTPVFEIVSTGASSSATQTLTNKTLTSPTISGGSITGVSTITLGTEQATTSGSSIDFTGIPSWVKRITISFVGVSLSGTDAMILLIGDAGGLEASGYQSAAGSIQNSGSSAVSSGTNYFAVTAGGLSTDTFHGTLELTLENSSSFTWTFRGALWAGATFLHFCAGSKSLSATLDRLSIDTTGTDTFDAGAINIQYE